MRRRLLIKNNSPNDAIRVLETAAELAPTGADNFFALAKAYLLKKDTDKALEAIITCSDLCLKVSSVTNSQTWRVPHALASIRVSYRWTARWRI